jgi:GT2 family glycosyltransferase
MSSPAAGRVSAVIVHYRTPAETLAAARAVAELSPGTEIVVVDNASGDSIAARLAAEVPAARLVVETENRGYGAACNRGARETSRPLLLFLNSDAFVAAGAVESLAAAIEDDPGAAVGDSRTLTAACSRRSSACRASGGSSSRARVWRGSPAAADRFADTRRRAKTTRSRSLLSPCGARRSSFGGPRSKRREGSTRPSSSTPRKRI